MNFTSIQQELLKYSFGFLKWILIIFAGYMGSIIIQHFLDNSVKKFRIDKKILFFLFLLPSCCIPSSKSRPPRYEFEKPPIEGLPDF